MVKIKLLIPLTILFTSITLVNCSQSKHLVEVKSKVITKNNSEYANPFIGTADTGHTFPGATYPFGMIQASPETGNNGWEYCSGYRYIDKKIWGFAQTHLNGTGVPDLGDILLQPFTGNIDRDNFQSSFTKSTETASPGYYAVTLSDFNVGVQLTATAHTSFHQYTFNDKNAVPRLLVDLQSGLVSSEDKLRTHVLESEVEIKGNTEIQGHSRVKHWVDRDYYYTIVFSKPFVKKTELPKLEGEKAPRYVLDFDLQPGEKLKVKVAMSTVSVKNAIENLEKESPDWSFEKVLKTTQDVWNNYFSRVNIVGTDQEKETFFTSFYHMLIQPNNIADVNGEYRGAKGEVHLSPNKTYYSTLSLWDTYRAAHPLYTILTPEKVDGFVNSMLDHFDANGYLPVWTLWGKESNCMIGIHSIPVIADAYLKGFKGFDTERAFNAIKISQTTKNDKSDWPLLDKLGYLPYDKIDVESVSRTLEQAYDDFAASKMAGTMGKKEDQNFFYNRSMVYKNLLDPETKLMRPKDSSGKWMLPFDQFKVSHASTSGGSYTEGNAWQYTWHVQQDVDGLAAQMGGKEFVIQKLDSLFKLKSDIKGEGFTGDVSGLIGQYAHGNEPSHHVAYLFTLLDEPQKTQELVREIVDTFYRNEPDGLAGNDDCGQMSAWYMFSAMGFYPVDPVGGEYVFGAPQLKKMTLQLPENKIFSIEAKNLSPQNKYVQSILLNGKNYDKKSIHHKDIMSGGSLIFTMGSQPK